MALKILITGLGSIARRHIRNLKLIHPEVEIGVWRQSSQSSQSSKDSDLGDISPLVSQVFFDLETSLQWRPKAALITNPSSLHVETALPLAEQGIHLLIEKPLSNSLDKVDELQKISRQKSVVIGVAYNFRFYKPFQIIKQALVDQKIGRALSFRAEVGYYLPAWRPQSDYRKSVSALKELGGGALLELSHELDYARWLMGEVESISSETGKLSRLEIDVEDTAEIILRFKSGSLGAIHLDMLDQARVRQCRIVGSEGTLVWEGIKHSVTLFTTDKNDGTILQPPGEIDLNDMYLQELRYFLQSVEDHREPVVSLEEAKRVLEIVLAAKQSSHDGRSIRL